MTLYRNTRPGAPHRSEPMPLAEGIRLAIAALGIETKILEQRALLLWPQAVQETAGEEAVRATRPDAIRRGELRVSVRQDAWRHRLLFEREHIRQRLNRLVGREVVQSIRFGR